MLLFHSWRSQFTAFCVRRAWHLDEECFVTSRNSTIDDIISQNNEGIDNMQNFKYIINRLTDIIY